MDGDRSAVAERCLHGAESGEMTFPHIVQTLSAAGFEGYAVDFRSGSSTYYGTDGSSLRFPTPPPAAHVAEAFDAAGIQGAILEAQHLVPGYTYGGFCRKVIASGCAGYMVSFSGRRAVYFGRTAEMHIEHFPE